MNYRKYIASWKWRRNRARVEELAGAGNRCRLCFGEGTPSVPLEAHHATYVRLGREIVGDLIALCRDCHHEVTTFLRRRRYAGHTTVRSDVRNLRDGRYPSFDPTRKEVTTRPEQ